MTTQNILPLNAESSAQTLMAQENKIRNLGNQMRCYSNTIKDNLQVCYSWLPIKQKKKKKLKYNWKDEAMDKNMEFYLSIRILSEDYNYNSKCIIVLPHLSIFKKLSF